MSTKNSGSKPRNPGGKPRAIKSPAQMLRLWEEFKAECDNQAVIAHEFSQRTGTFASAELRKKISYTIEGFCVFLKIPRNSFYMTYSKDPAYRDVVTRIHEECEVDVRGKFETGQIPPQLAALWMGKFGYSTNTGVKVDAEDLVNDWIDGVMKNTDEDDEENGGKE